MTNTRPTQVLDLSSDSSLRVAVPVSDNHGRSLGRVAALHHDALTGRLTELTIRHGLLRPRYTRVSVADISDSDQGSISIAVSRAMFKQLPRCGDPAVRGTH